MILIYSHVNKRYVLVITRVYKDIHIFTLITTITTRFILIKIINASITRYVDKGDTIVHINCQKEDLVYGVQVVSRAVSNKNTLPVLSGIMLTAQDNTLTFRATDLEMAIECSIDVEVIENGTVILQGKYFNEIVRKLPSGLINIKSTNNYGIEIKYDKSNLNMHGFDPEEFPLFPNISGIVHGSIDQDLFKNMIKQVSIATSHDEARPVFTGILMEIEENEVTMVATDTHRLALRKGLWKGDLIKEKVSFIVPSRTMIEVARIIGDETEPLYITVSENQVYFKTGNISLISRLIDGQYPAYNQVIPSNTLNKSKIRVRTKKLLEAGERASLLARDELKEKSSVIKITVNDSNMVINSNSAEIGKIHEEINIFLDGELTEIAFNSKYLIDALKVIDAEEIKIDLTGPLSPGIIRPVEGENYLYLILPVRTS